MRTGDASLGGRQEADQDGPVGDVRVDDVDPLGGCVEGLLDGVADRVVTLARDVVEDGRASRHGPALRRREEVIQGASSVGSVPPWYRNVARNRAWSCATTGPVTRTIES